MPSECCFLKYFTDIFLFKCGPTCLIRQAVGTSTVIMIQKNITFKAPRVLCAENLGPRLVHVRGLSALVYSYHGTRCYGHGTGYNYASRNFTAAFVLVLPRNWVVMATANCYDDGHEWCESDHQQSTSVVFLRCRFPAPSSNR